MNNPFSLKEKNVLVTGASSGIGKAIAIECSKNEASLIITARNQSRLEETFKAMEGDGHQMILFDLTNSEELNNLIDHLTPIDGFVHCVGIEEPKPLQNISAEDIHKIMYTNAESGMLLTQQLIKKKLLKKGASIVFISSIAGVQISMSGGALYCASKGALNGFMKAIAIELSVKRIRVNSINPGMIETDLLKDKLDDEQIENEKLKYPLGRFGKPEEVAYAAVYLLSDASGWVTGSNLIIDGGYTLL